MLYLNQSGHPKRKSERGQSLLELSLGMLFFFIFALGLLDLGRLYFMYIALQDSAGEAAMFLSVNAKCNYPPGYPVSADPDTGGNASHIDAPSTLTRCADPNNGLFRARNAAGDYFEWENANIDIDYITGGKGVGNTVRVTIRHPFALVTPIITNIVGEDTLTLTATATQTIMMETNDD